MKSIQRIFRTVSDKLAKRRNILFLDCIFLAFFAILFLIIRLDILTITFYITTCLYILLTSRKRAVYNLILSSAIALVWVFIAKDMYHYNREMISIAGMNAFPLFAWAAALFWIYIMYSRYESAFTKKRIINRLAVFTAIYWVLLISAETIAYHLFNVKDIATAAYVGLPICNCMHAPMWMQAVYFSLGPLYFLLCEMLGIKNPNKQTTKNKRLLK